MDHLCCCFKKSCCDDDQFEVPDIDVNCISNCCSRGVVVEVDEADGTSMGQQQQQQH